MADKSRPRSKNTNVKGLDLKSKEEEYKRLNDELEARTASLLQDAESVIRGQDDSISTQPSLLERVNMDDYLKEWDSSDLNKSPVVQESARPSSSRPSSSRPSSKVSNTSRLSAKGKKGTASKQTTVKKSSIGKAASNVAVPDFSLQTTISNIENKFDKGDAPLSDEDDDVIPAVAAEMAPEAQMRFLRAKLRVMQEELDKLAEEYGKKDEENTRLQGQLRDVDEERSRLSRINTTHQQQMEKYRKLSEDAKSKADSLENQLAAANKELNGIKRAQKKQESNQGVTEVRLNRALEEIEKLKDQLQKSKSSAKEVTDGEKRKVEQLLAENKRLEKQKNELLAGFKKQLKLIDILKRQRMHIEAAKMLQFSEEEFVKALEWGKD